MRCADPPEALPAEGVSTPGPGGRGAALRAGGRLALALCPLLSACARELPPPGTHPDRQPPRISRIEPPPDSVVAGFDGRIRIRFDEPVNIPNDLVRRIVASPVEPYQMETGFSDMRLRPRDGWRQGVVYCLSIPDGISDLLRNRMEERTSFCFSTGPPLEDTRVSGIALDAVTGQPQNEVRVLFLAPGDSTPYGALSDTEGRFSLRALPPGEYEAFGFVDQNRNLSLDRQLEAHDSLRFAAAPGAPVELELRLVPADSTPPRLLRAEAADSLTLQLEFDDPLLNPQPEAPTVAVRDSASGLEVTVVALGIGRPHEAGLPPLAASDSVGADPDSLPAGEPGAPRPGFGPPAPAQEADTAAAPLPSRFVSLRISSALGPGTYRVSSRGFTNLRRLVGGGDTTFVVAAPAADSVPPPAPDTLSAPERAREP